jgi:nicotinate-nucleotide adenylyltransferase
MSIHLSTKWAGFILLTLPALGFAARVGVYTGSFDPPHIGHQAVAQTIQKQFGLDILYVVPDKSVGYKTGMQTPAHRNQMLKLLFANEPGIRVFNETQDAAQGPGEMWDVIRVVQSEHPTDEVFALMGSDTLKWYQTLPPENRNKQVTLLVARRDEAGRPPAPIPPAEFEGQKIVDVKLNTGDGISSSKIRKQIQAGVEPRDLTPELNAYIQRNHLYGAITGLPLNSPQQCVIQAINNLTK